MKGDPMEEHSPKNGNRVGCDFLAREESFVA